jgi:hypothetical protein
VRVGVLGGAEDIPEDRMREAMDARAKILSDALKATVETATVALKTANSRLSTVRRARFVGSLLGAISSGGVIAATFADSIATIIVAVVALGSNAVGLFADTLVLGQRGSEQELVEAARLLSRSSGEAALTQQLLVAFQKITYDLDEMAALLAGGNKLFAELNDALSKVLP